MKTPQSIWKAAEDAVVAGDLVTLEGLFREHETLFREQRPQSSWLGGLAPDYSGADTRRILAREHNFGSFDELAEHLEALRRRDSPVASFEAAADAVVAGDLFALNRRLRQNPELIHARSARKHRATLVHQWVPTALKAGASEPHGTPCRSRSFCSTPAPRWMRWRTYEKVRADPRMLAALRGETPDHLPPPP